MKAAEDIKLSTAEDIVTEKVVSLAAVEGSVKIMAEDIPSLIGDGPAPITAENAVNDINASIKPLHYHILNNIITIFSQQQQCILLIMQQYLWKNQI